MRSPVLILTLTLLALSAPAFGASRPEVKLALSSELVPATPAPGDRAEIRLTLKAPDGIVLNRYPGITFTPEPVEGLLFASEKVHLGLEKPAKDPAEFYFAGDVPLVVPLEVRREARGRIGVSGELKYFYCVKKSGYCAPARERVEITVPVATR